VSEPDSSASSRADSLGPLGDALDPITVLKQHPEWFFRAGQFDLEEAIGLIVAEASRGGARQVTVTRYGPWVAIQSDKDWLDGDVGAFFAPLAYSEGGRNSARAEALLTAFCRAVITISADGILEVSSSPEAIQEPTSPPLEETTTGRIVTFLPSRSSGHASSHTDQLEANREGKGFRLIQGGGEQSITSAVQKIINNPRRLDG
jgi:hypothetical protein